MVAGDEGRDTRTRLLDAADQLIWERGYEVVGVAELCAVAKAPRGSFYYWWPSKQALVLAVIARSWERTRRMLFEPVFGADVSFGEQLDRYVETLVGHLQQTKQSTARVPGCQFGNLAAELSTRDSVVRDALDGVFVDMQRIFADAVSRAIDRGELSGSVDAADAGEAICAHMEGLMILVKARHEPVLLRRLSIDARRLVGATRPRTDTEERR